MWLTTKVADAGQDKVEAAEYARPGNIFWEDRRLDGRTGVTIPCVIDDCTTSLEIDTGSPTAATDRDRKRHGTVSDSGIRVDSSLPEQAAGCGIPNGPDPNPACAPVVFAGFETFESLGASTDPSADVSHYFRIGIQGRGLVDIGRAQRQQNQPIGSQ